MWSFICTRLKRISYSCSHANYRFVRDDEGVGDGALLTDKLYPALAGLCPSLEGYKSMTPVVAKRYAELCAGKPENRFDRVLREKVYPVIAWVQTFSSTS